MNGYLSTETINLSVYTLKRDISGGFKYIHYYFVVLLVSSPSQLGIQVTYVTTTRLRGSTVLRCNEISYSNVQ